MSVDTVNEALTKVRLFILNNFNSFTPEGQTKLLAIADCMRESLMKDDVKGFDQYVDSILAREPDAAVFILDELYLHLGFGEEGVREQLDAELAAG